jgi:integral membrane protein
MSIKNFRYVAIAEAISWLVLLTATIAKYAADGPDLAPILGPIHGILVLAYVYGALSLREDAGWNGNMTLGVLAAAVIPFGGFVVERRVLAPAAPA